MPIGVCQVGGVEAAIALACHVQGAAGIACACVADGAIWGGLDLGYVQGTCLAGHYRLVLAIGEVGDMGFHAGEDEGVFSCAADYLVACMGGFDGVVAAAADDGGVAGAGVGDGVLAAFATDYGISCAADGDLVVAIPGGDGDVMAAGVFYGVCLVGGGDFPVCGAVFANLDGLTDFLRGFVFQRAVVFDGDFGYGFVTVGGGVAFLVKQHAVGDGVHRADFRAACVDVCVFFELAGIGGAVGGFHLPCHDAEGCFSCGQDAGHGGDCAVCGYFGGYQGAAADFVGVGFTSYHGGYFLSVGEAAYFAVGADGYAILVFAYSEGGAIFQLDGVARIGKGEFSAALRAACVVGESVLGAGDSAAVEREAAHIVCGGEGCPFCQSRDA